jgi:D-glucosaminate-6-phosphate ammonia-lyase
MARHVAELLSAPAAMITTGCASGLTLASAAAMAGDSPTFIQQLPNTAGMKSELLIQANQRYHYDRALEFSGATLVEFGDSSAATAAQLAAAIKPSTAAVVFVAGGSRSGGASYIDKGPVMDFDEVVAIATRHGLPVAVGLGRIISLYYRSSILYHIY